MNFVRRDSRVAQTAKVDDEAECTIVMIYERRALIVMHKKILLPDGWAIARIIREQMRDAFLPPSVT